MDAAFSRVPASVAPYSSVVARVLIDGSWARAMTGSMSTLLWPIAAVVGVLWGLEVGDCVGLPAGWLLVLALVLGVLDSLVGGIVSLALTVVAFAIGAMTQALNGLSGTVIADGSDLTLVKWTVWIAMIARLALEDLAVHLFPERSRAVQPPRLPRQTKFWGMFGAALRFALHPFVAAPF